MAEPRARSALARFAAADGPACWSAEGIALRELPYVAIVRVQALDDDGCAAAGTAIGVALPGPGTLVQGDGLRVAWVAQSQWLVFLAPSAEPALLAALAAAGVSEKLELDLFAGEHMWGGNKSVGFFRKNLHAKWE